MIAMPVAAPGSGVPPAVSASASSGHTGREFFAREDDAPSVLIAEDHADSLDALRTLLEAFGYHVLVARNGREAVEVALARRPDLVLMDMMMPLMDGFEATRILRADSTFRQVPILAVTALESSRREALDAGCDDLVAKPLDVRRFLDTLRGWVHTGRSVA